MKTIERDQDSRVRPGPSYFRQKPILPPANRKERPGIINKCSAFYQELE